MNQPFEFISQEKRARSKSIRLCWEGNVQVQSWKSVLQAISHKVTTNPQSMSEDLMSLYTVCCLNARWLSDYSKQIIDCPLLNWLVYCLFRFNCQNAILNSLEPRIRDSWPGQPRPNTFQRMGLKGIERGRKVDAALAQLVERSLSKRKVAGSSPACGYIFCRYGFRAISKSTIQN